MGGTVLLRESVLSVLSLLSLLSVRVTLTDRWFDLVQSRRSVASFGKESHDALATRSIPALSLAETLNVLDSINVKPRSHRKRRAGAPPYKVNV